MTQKQYDWVVERSKSSKYSTRQKVAKDPDTPVEIVNNLILDDDSRVSLAAALDGNIDESTLGLLLESYDISSNIFIELYKNRNFKEKWITNFIHVLKAHNISPMFIIYSNRFLKNMDDWLKTFDEVVKVQEEVGSLIDVSISNEFFVIFVRKVGHNKNIFKSKAILKILDTFGELFYSVSGGMFSAILENIEDDDQEVRQKIYEITDNPKYLPQILQDVFIF